MSWDANKILAVSESRHANRARGPYSCIPRPPLAAGVEDGLSFNRFALQFVAPTLRHSGRLLRHSGRMAAKQFPRGGLANPTMNLSRAIRGLRSVGRSVEVLRCIGECPDWKSIVPAYVGIHHLTYPYVFRLRSGAMIRLADWEDLTTAWAVFFGDEYRVDRSDRVVVDLGANIGAFTVMASKAAPHARIIAVEPFPANFARLNACVQENRLEDRVRCRPWAIAARQGTVIMDGAAHIPSHTRRLVDAASAIQPVQVECHSLEELFSIEELKSVDYLKIDIEGAEFDLITQTPPDVLRVAKTIGIECHGTEQDRERLWPAFSDAGFYARRIARRPFWTTAEMTRK